MAAPALLLVRGPSRAGPPPALRPMLWINDRIRSSARLVVLATVLLVPGLLASWSYAAAMTGQIDFAQNELAGTLVLRPALSAIAGAASGQAPDLTQLEAADQFVVVGQLDVALNATIERVGSMAELTERLERRGASRQRIAGTVRIVVGDRQEETDLVDLSETGLRCHRPPGADLSAGRPVQVRVRAAGRTFECRATVVREIQDLGTDLGLTFLAPDAETLAGLHAVLASHPVAG